MVKTAFSKGLAWLRDAAFPAVVDTINVWWDDIDENPKAHFFSMLFGMFMLVAVKLLVWLAA